jgi:hypothetical protein
VADLRRQAALHGAWWRRANAVPLVKNWYPEPGPCGGLDIDVPVREIAARKLRNAEAQRASIALQDSLITAGVNFATALYPAAAGADYRFDAHTSWTVPKASRARDVRIGPFDPHQPLYAQYIARLEAVLAHWSWDTYLPVPGGRDGPSDILAGFLGPEALAVELYEAPDDVKAAAEAATDFMCEAIAYEKRLFRSAGVGGEGMATAFNTYQPGWATVFVEDFTALIGPDHYREFFLEHDRRLVAQFDSVLFHTHSAGYRNLPEMLKLPRHVAFEFGNDPKGPGPAQRIEAVRAILADGRPAVCGSWNILLPAEEIGRIVHGLPAQGLDLRFQCGSAAEARDLYERIKAEKRPA